MAEKEEEKENLRVSHCISLSFHMLEQVPTNGYSHDINLLKCFKSDDTLAHLADKKKRKEKVHVINTAYHKKTTITIIQ